MAFGISQSVRSRGVQVCTPELFHQATQSSRVKDVCAQIEAATILECGVGREDRELALQLSLHRIIVLLADFATALAFECVLNLRANVLHPATLGICRS